MYVAVIPNRGSPPVILLRESYREAGKTRNRTLANLSGWPAEPIEQFRAVLRGDKLLPAAEAVEIVRALPHGHVLAALPLPSQFVKHKYVDIRMLLKWRMKTQHITSFMLHYPERRIGQISAPLVASAQRVP